MQAPLLPDGADEEDFVRAAVTCRGASAALVLLLSTGGVSYQPDQGNAPRCFGLVSGWQTKRHDIPGAAVVGAALESPTTLQVWYFHRLRSLRKTPPLQCASGQEASRMVAAVRAAASSWARGRPPRVLAIIEPHAARAYARHALPILEAGAGLSVAAAPARGPAHAAELVRAADAAAADVIAVCGSDAAFSEAVQGLLARDDWEEAAAQLPLAHIPVPRPPRLPGRPGGGGGGELGGGGGSRLARAAGITGAAAGAWAVVKGALARRDVASVLQPPGRRRFMLLSLEAGGGPLDVLLHRTTTVDAAWLPCAGPPTPSFTPATSPSPRGLPPAGSPALPRGPAAAAKASAAAAAAAPAAAGGEAGPPLAHVKRLAESRAMLGPRPAAAAGPAAAAAAAPFSSPLAHSVPSGWCSRLQLRVHNMGASLAPPQPPAAAAAAARGGSSDGGGAGAEGGGAAAEGGGGTDGAGRATLRVVCAAEGRGVKGHIRAIKELLTPLAERASSSGGAGRASGSGGGARRRGARPATPGAQQLLPVVMSEDVSAAAFTPTGLASMRLVVDGVRLPPPAPGAATLVEVHAGLILTTAGPGDP